MCKSQTWRIKIGLIFAHSTLEETTWKKSSFTVKNHSSEKLVNDKNQNWLCTIYTWPLSILKKSSDPGKEQVEKTHIHTETIIL